MTCENNSHSKTENTQSRVLLRFSILHTCELVLGVTLGVGINYFINHSIYKTDAPVLMAMGMTASVPINRFLERVAQNNQFFSRMYPHLKRIFLGGFTGGISITVVKNML